MWCAVWNCKSSNQRGKTECSFFSFPSDKKLLKAWIHFCRRKDYVNWANARICSAHFDRDDYHNNVKFELGFCTRRLLRPDAVPHLNPQNQDDPQPTERSNRMVARHYKQIAQSALNEHAVKTPEIEIVETADFVDAADIEDTAGIEDETDIADTTECNNPLEVKSASTPPKEKHAKKPADNEEFSKFLELSANGIKNACNTFANNQTIPQDSTSLLFESLAVSIRNANLKYEQINEIQACICEFVYGKLKELQ